MAFPAAAADPPHEAVATVRGEINVSLRTRDPAVAKARTGIVISHLESLWASVRKGPQPLTHKQIVALSGKVYRLLSEGFEDEPGGRERWIAVKAFNRAAREGRLESPPELDPARIGASLDALSAWRPRDITTALNALPPDERAKLIAMERRFGFLADWTLAKHGIVTDEDSRRKLLAQVDLASTQAAQRLKANADGDYSPDTNAARFPRWNGHATPTSPAAPVVGLTFDALFQRWARERAPAASTVSTWRGHLRQLTKHLGHDDPRRVTRADIIAWKDSLVERGLKGINEGHLASIKALFNYAVRNDILTNNPADNITVARRARTRGGVYTDEEVARLLALAEAEKDSVRRWLPWLAALSGARIGEIAQLWGRRVTTIDGIPVLRIAPAEDGGSLKNAHSERDIPIHPALIERGFLEFVKSAGDGPLFYGRSGRNAARPRTNDPDKPRKHASKGVTNRLSEWIRKQGFTDCRKAPNHALRHWFKTACIKAGIQDSLADAIQGHTHWGMEADRYRHPDVRTKAQAVATIKVPVEKHGHDLARSSPS